MCAARRPAAASLLLLAFVLGSPEGAGAQTAAAAAQAPPAASQDTAVIRGTVVDERTEQPLARVLVRLADTEYKALTGPDGRFELRGVKPGDYTATVSVVGYGLLRKAVTAKAGATLEFTFVLTAGTGTYEEKVDVVAPVFERREPGSVSEQTLGATEIQDLRGLVADDPLRAIQAMPGVTATDDFSAEFSARGAGPKNTAVLLDGIPASAVLLHTVEGRNDSGSIARISSDVLSRATLMLGAYPQRTGDRLGPQLEFLTRDGSRDGFHLRTMVSMIAAGGVAEGPIAGGRGSWLASVRQSYLDWIIRRLYADYNSFMGFTDAFGRVVFDATARHQLSLTVLAGRSHYEEANPGTDPNAFADAASHGGMAVVGLRSTGQTWSLNQRVYGQVNTFQNTQPAGLEIGSGRYVDAGYRADFSRALGARLTLDGGGQAQRVDDRQSMFAYDRRVPPRKTTLDTYDTRATRGGAYAHLRWQAAPASLLTAGARIDGSSQVAGAAASPWLQFEQVLPRGVRIRAGTGLYRQEPSSEELAGLHGGGDNLGRQRALHADVGIEQVLGARTRWQVAFYNRDERDVVFASGLEPRASGALVPYNPAARYENRLDGYARGIETVLQRRDPNGLSGWIAYAYEQSHYRDPKTGESFDGDYDQRHTLNVYASLRLWSRARAIAKYRVGSNIPVRGYYAPTGLEDSEGLPTFVLGPARNAGRLPTYSRLDLRVDQVFNFSTRRLTLFVELINVTNRTNAGLSGGRYLEKLLPLVPAAGFLVEF